MRRRGMITFAVAVAVAAAAALCGGCGTQAKTGGSGHPAAATSSPPSAAASAAHRAGDQVAVAHPQAVEPVAGAAPGSSPSTDAGSAPSADAGSTPSAAGVSVQGAAASGTLPEPSSLAEVRRQLTESGLQPSATRATLTPGGLAVAPIDAPAAVQEVIAAGNEIARLPYIWGGGHMTYEDSGYDCSGSISYVFAAAHLLNQTVTSGELENWGAAGPGKWITVFANAGHTFMYVAGLRFDTVALAQTGTRWSDRPATEGDLSSFSVRHPPGL